MLGRADRSLHSGVLPFDFEILRGRRDTVQENLELVLAGWPSIGLRDVELCPGVAGWRNRLRGFVDDLSILVGPTRLHRGRCCSTCGRDRRVDRIVWFERIGVVADRLVGV